MAKKAPPPPILVDSVKETVDAKLSEDDMLNQYALLEEVGRGSFGAVRRAVDVNTNHVYAIKEFSKSRLRRMSKAALLRERGPRSPRSPRSAWVDGGGGGGGGRPDQLVNNFDLIRHETEILKTLAHENIAALFEVLDTAGDSMFMVLEWCGPVVMKVDLFTQQTPYDDRQCRLYFRDLLAAVAYLHARHIVHRDIKPDNLLVTQANTLKLVDFGVAERFDTDDGMSKRVGSPAFMAPEMNSRKPYSARAADVWAMGVTLYTLVYGKLPFAHANPLELARAIGEDAPDLSGPCAAAGVLARLLEKDQSRRICVEELMRHEWVTSEGWGNAGT